MSKSLLFTLIFGVLLVLTVWYYIQPRTGPQGVYKLEYSENPSEIKNVPIEKDIPYSIICDGPIQAIYVDDEWLKVNNFYRGITLIFEKDCVLKAVKCKEQGFVDGRPIIDGIDVVIRKNVNKYHDFYVEE